MKTSEADTLDLKRLIIFQMNVSLETGSDFGEMIWPHIIDQYCGIKNIP
jgi:hypothetical protein